MQPKSTFNKKVKVESDSNKLQKKKSETEESGGISDSSKTFKDSSMISVKNYK